MSTIAVTSLNPADWREDPQEEAERMSVGHRLNLLDAEGNARILRAYYPLKAKLKKHDPVLGFQMGTVLKYARVKRIPARFPIEVYFSGRDGNGDVKVKRVSYDSTEAELVFPTE